MKLYDWLQDTGTTIEDFAARIGVSKNSAHKYAKKNVIPRRKVIIKIFIETVGQVSANDFYNLGNRVKDDEDVVEDDNMTENTREDECCGGCKE